MSLHPELTEQEGRAEAESQRQSLRRVRMFAGLAYGAFAIWFAVTRDWRSLVGLTCSALVVMINFLWLEEIVSTLFQPAPQVNARPVLVRILSRFILFGVALSVVIFIARFSVLSILLGFSIIVVGIMAEALYSAVSAARSS